MALKQKSSFSGSIGFVLAAAGSAVGLGNIWRFPYLAAKDGGGLFLLVYLLLVLTFGFSLLVTDIAIGRRTKCSALRAFGEINKKWKFLGILTFAVPAVIITYYSVVGGWVTKYAVAYVTLQGKELAADNYFTSFISSPVSSIVFMLLFHAATSFIVYCGVEKGIERFSKFIMPCLFLMIVGISAFSLTLKHTADDGTVRTGLQGLGVYLLPNFEGLTLTKFLGILLDAVSQLFFSLSVAMGIMITYGSYVKDDVNLSKSVGQIEIFDTIVAFLAGMMILPAVYVFFGTEGMASGPSLLFISLPKVFEAMGALGSFIGAVFFLMVLFAALTSSISVMEVLVAGCIEALGASRKKISLIIGIVSAIAAVAICLGYSVFYFELPLPNGSVGQLLDVMDYLSNSFMMPIVSLLTCIFVGWIIKPKWICEEMERSGHIFHRKMLHNVIIRYIAPILMFVMFLQSIGAFNLIEKLVG